MAWTAGARAGIAPIEGLPTFQNSSVLTTTPVLITQPANGSTLNRWRVVFITNYSPANNMAWSVVDRGAAAPTITADTAATGACPILPSSQVQIPLPPGVDLYVVASAAGTLFNATTFLLG